MLSLNGAKNNPKIVTKITAVRPKGGGIAQAPPLKYATEQCVFLQNCTCFYYTYMVMIHFNPDMRADISNCNGEKIMLTSLNRHQR